MLTRYKNPVDNAIAAFDNALVTLFGNPPITNRPNPSDGLAEYDCSTKEQKHTSRLMRINHAGEVSAQALYQGQALTAKLPDVREAMHHAAQEENDHLLWCGQRVSELGSRTSMLSPLWYMGSFTIGAIAGKIGDKWSLGFVAETEKQVVKHLDEHAAQISIKDQKTQAILAQMKIDETAHGHAALAAGGAALPAPVKWAMQLTSKLMTRGSYWL